MLLRTAIPSLLTDFLHALPQEPGIGDHSARVARELSGAQMALERAGGLPA
jgi:hypothetical protein